jgi:hypothetical protein
MIRKLHPVSSMRRMDRSVEAAVMRGGSDRMLRDDFDLFLMRNELRPGKQLSRTFRLPGHLQLINEAKRLRENYSGK